MGVGVTVACPACGGPHLLVDLDPRHEPRRLVLTNWHDTLRPRCAGLFRGAAQLDTVRDGWGWAEALVPDWAALVGTALDAVDEARRTHEAIGLDAEDA